MKIIAFNGSPRKGGNTQLLLQAAARGAESAGARVTIHDLNGMNIRPCQSCGKCFDTARCVLPDDMQAVHADIRTADRIILASPLYFSGLTGQMKIMIDRCQPFWAEKYLRHQPVPLGPHGRKGLLLLLGAMKRTPRNKGFDCAETVARAFFRTVNVPEHAMLGYDGVDAAGAIKDHPTALQDAYEAGKALVS